MKLLTTLSVLKMLFGLGTSPHLILPSHTHSSGQSPSVHSMYLGFLQVPVLGLVLSTHTSLTTMALHPPNASPQIKIYSLQHSSKPQIQRAPSPLDYNVSKTYPTPCGQTELVTSSYVPIGSPRLYHPLILLTSLGTRVLTLHWASTIIFLIHL